jgi:hypothetical protein
VNRFFGMVPPVDWSRNSTSRDWFDLGGQVTARWPLLLVRVVCQSRHAHAFDWLASPVAIPQLTIL